jgi:hypothetical protein
MRAGWGSVRALYAALVCAAALGVAGCSTQPRQEVDVGIGTGAYAPKAGKPYAVLYKPYAQMAALAYANPPYLTGKACPDANKLASSSDKDDVILAKMARALHDAHWACLSGHVGPFGCKAGTPRCVGGLEYHLWRHQRDGRCDTAVIAFRGTDTNDIGDWLSDFRWLLGRRFFDQYDQVQLAVFDIIDSLPAYGCHPDVIVATGHSLGGGLAQHAAYSDKRITYVYAFDPSPVTAFFDVPMAKRDAAKERLGIDRIYEAGEILSLPRYIASGVFPSSQCRPRVRIVRFATGIQPSVVERHRIRNLVAGLNMLAAGATSTDKGRLGFAHARTCDFVQPDKFGE